MTAVELGLQLRWLRLPRLSGWGALLCALMALSVPQLRWPFWAPHFHLFSLPSLCLSGFKASARTATRVTSYKEAILVTGHSQQATAGPFPWPSTAYFVYGHVPFHAVSCLLYCGEKQTIPTAAEHGSAVLSVQVCNPSCPLPHLALGPASPSCLCDFAYVRSLMDGNPTVSVFLWLTFRMFCFPWL